MEGFLVVDCPKVVNYLVKEFSSRNKPIIFTLSATFMIIYHFDLLKEIADLSNFIFCNREEAVVFSKLTENV